MLSSCIVSQPLLPQAFTDYNNYTSCLSLIIEALPKIDKRKDLLAERSGWIRHMLELGIRLIDSRKKIRFSEEQELVGSPDSLPIKLIPKTTFWSKIVDLKPNLLTELNDG